MSEEEEEVTIQRRRRSPSLREEDDDDKEEEDDDAVTCMVCLQKPTNMMLLRKTAVSMIPCGHLTICKPCFHRCDRCPLCRKRYRNNEHIMTPAEENRLIARLRRVSLRRDDVDEKIAELQTKRAEIDEEFSELTAIRERQRILLRRRANHLDESNFVNL